MDRLPSRNESPIAKRFFESGARDVWAINTNQTTWRMDSFALLCRRGTACFCHAPGVDHAQVLWGCLVWILLWRRMGKILSLWERACRGWGGLVRRGGFVPRGGRVFQAWYGGRHSVCVSKSEREMPWGICQIGGDVETLRKWRHAGL